MRRESRSTRNSAVTVGWLFADLLLALAMIFLIANTVNSAPKSITRIKPTPTLTPTPTPKIPRLELHYHRFVIQVDANGLLSNDNAAIKQAKQEIRAQKILQGRNVGLVIAYGGAPTTDDITNAQNVASKMYSIMRSLGQDHFAFSKASYYDPVYNLSSDVNLMTIDVFLFTS